MQGGGTTVLASSGNQIGPGGQSIAGGVLAYHYYDANGRAAPPPRAAEPDWTADGWPQLGAGDQIAGRPTTS